MKSKPSIPKVELNSEGRRHTFYHENYRRFETPLKSDRMAKKGKLLESTAKKEMSAVDMNVISEGYLNKSESNLLSGDKHSMSTDDFGASSFARKKSHKLSMMDNTFSE